jgi:hypothetical protein
MTNSSKMTFKEQIAEVEKEIQALNVVYAPLHKKMNELTSTLANLKNQFDVGDKVYVEDTCRRGCCIEDSYHGTITNVEFEEWRKIYHYTIRQDNTDADRKRQGTYGIKRI